MLVETGADRERGKLYVKNNRAVLELPSSTGSRTELSSDGLVLVDREGFARAELTYNEEEPTLVLSRQHTQIALGLMSAGMFLYDQQNTSEGV